jgi:CRISPR/Cas system-associated protein endoribonuclease Cas2
MNLYDDHQLEGAKRYMEEGNHHQALSMLEKLLKQYPKHGEIKALTLKAKKLSALRVPVVIKTKNEEIVVGKKRVVGDENHPSWWRKFF